MFYFMVVDEENIFDMFKKTKVMLILLNAFWDRLTFHGMHVKQNVTWFCTSSWAYKSKNKVCCICVIYEIGCVFHSLH